MYMLKHTIFPPKLQKCQDGLLILVMWDKYSLNEIKKKMTTTFLDLIKGCIRQDRKKYNFISVVYHVSCIVSYLSKRKNEVKSWMLTENDKRISCWNVQKEEYITVGTNTLFGGCVKYAKVSKLKFLSPSLISLFRLFNTQSLSLPLFLLKWMNV